MELSKTKKIINGILFVLFAVFAIVQVNDPDPLIWVILYALVAVVSLLANFVVIPRRLIHVLFIGYLLYASFHFLHFIDYLQIDNKNELFGEMVYEKPYLEGTREFLGLLMAAIALLFQIKKKKFI